MKTQFLMQGNTFVLLQRTLVILLAWATVFSSTVHPQDSRDAESDRFAPRKQYTMPVVDETLVAPANDNFANAQVLASGDVTLANLSNAGATAEAGEPFHGAGRGAPVTNSIWFKYTAATNMMVSVRLQATQTGAIGDTVISAYKGTSMANLIPVAENDDYINTLYSEITFGAVSGNTYYIAIDGYAGAFGSFNMVTRVDPTPMNDNRGNASLLLNSSRSPSMGITDSNLTATGQGDEVNHGGVSVPLNSIWYYWTPDTTGSHTFTTEGSNFNTVLAVYRNDGLGYPEVASNDDFGRAGIDKTSRVTFYASTSYFYYIVIDGTGVGTDKGNTVLNWYPNREESGKRYDFDGDVKADISLFRPMNGGPGQWWIKKSTGGHFATSFGYGGVDLEVPADFTGDGKIDIAYWRQTNGYWYVLRSEDYSYYAFPFGASGDIPATGQFDNDARADYVVFRPSAGTWYINASNEGVSTVSFGAPGDTPTVADYDGDGRSDIAVFRPSNGQWWVRRSREGTIAATFGNQLDYPLPGDYTGDGRADAAFWRPSTGEWFVLRSLAGGSYYSFPFGLPYPSDVPAPADYDGDGKFDAAVFRHEGGVWYINKSNGSGTLIEQFGTAGDHPVPSSTLYY